MTDETGKNDETKPAAEAAPKPSRRQIAMLGAATPVLLTLPIRRAAALAPGQTETETIAGACHRSTFSADPSYQDGVQRGPGQQSFNIHYSCIGDDVVKYKTRIS